MDRQRLDLFLIKEPAPSGKGRKVEAALAYWSKKSVPQERNGRVPVRNRKQKAFDKTPRGGASSASLVGSRREPERIGKEKGPEKGPRKPVGSALRRSTVQQRREEVAGSA